MATISGFSTLCSICRSKSYVPYSASSLSIPLRVVHLQSRVVYGNPTLVVVASNKKQLQRARKVVRSVAKDTQIPEEAEYDNNENTEQTQEEASKTSDEPVSVPVSPSDFLTMFFQAEGTMTETAIPAVTNALQETEGISNLKVQVVEGLGSVELTKQTTVQSTGVASNLVETIQGSGFKLQTLNLSFEDEDGIN